MHTLNWTVEEGEEVEKEEEEGEEDRWSINSKQWLLHEIQGEGKVFEAYMYDIYMYL